MNTKSTDLIKPDIVTDEHLLYLDSLRESGVTNMYGAPAYLQQAFDISQADAIEIWVYWKSPNR